MIYKQVSDANMLTLTELKNHLEVEVRILDRVSFQLANGELKGILESPSPQSGKESFPDPAQKNKLDALFRSLGSSWPEIKNMYVYSIEGGLYGHVAEEIALPDPSLNDYQHKDVNIEHGVLLNRSKQQSYSAFSYIRLIRSADGQPLGWLRFDLLFNELPFIQELKQDRRALFIYESHGNLLLSNKPQQLDIVLVSKILNLEDQSGYFFDSGNLVTYINARNIDWRIVSIVPKSILNEGLIKIRIISILLVIVSFGISFFVLMALSYRITRPLRALSKAMRQVEEGNFKVRVQIADNDEIGRLAQHLNQMLDSIDQLINQNYRGEIKYRDAQFKMLLSQINPHFLYNTLEIIDILSLKGKKKEVSAIVLSLSSMFRYVLKSNKVVVLQDEVNNAKSYLNIQMIRFSENLQVRFRMSEERMQYRVPIFILQPLLENCFKHGFQRRMKKNHILIYTENDGSKYSIHIVDNGIGISSERLIELRHVLDNMEPGVSYEGENIGLRNVHERIRLTFGAPYGLRIDSREGYWFKATILLPMSEEGETYGLPNGNIGR